MLGDNRSNSQGTEKVIFRTTVRFLSVLTGIMDRCGATNNLFVGGFKNGCRLTDVNLNYLRTINQDFWILNSIFFFRSKIWNKPVRGSELTNPDLMTPDAELQLHLTCNLYSPPRASMKSF